MKRYRILSDGDKFRIQKHIRFGPFNYWLSENYYEVRESYPKVVSKKVEFDNREDARNYVREQMKHQKPAKRWWPFSIPRGWQVVENFSDKPLKRNSETANTESFNDGVGARS